MGDEIRILENYLAKRMTPLEPRPELIARLQTRLVQAKPEGTVLVKPVPAPGWVDLKYILFGAAGLISSVLLIITGVKSIQGMRKLRAARSAAPSLTNAV